MKDGVPFRVRMAAKAAANKPLRTHTHRRVAENHNPHNDRNIKPWSPLPTEWQGHTFHIVGGGPSLKSQEAITRMRQAARNDVWIAVNNAYKIAPWADILHFADCQWWRWYGAAVLKEWPKDRIITTATSDVTHVNGPRIKRFWRNRNEFTLDKMKVYGQDSGTQAVNIAFHLGAAKIVLWGIDMQVGEGGETHWHPEHPRPTVVANYDRKFGPPLHNTVVELAKLEVPVVRATEPGLDVIPFEPHC